MHSTEKNQAISPTELRKKYDYLSESWFRIDHALKTGSIVDIEPAFRVGRKRVYERRTLDQHLSFKKFGDELPKAREHRQCLFPLVPMHEAPVEPTMPPLPFARAYTLAHAENAARDRINRTTPKKKRRLPSSPPLQWALTYEADNDGNFELSDSITLKEEKGER